MPGWRVDLETVRVYREKLGVETNRDDRRVGRVRKLHSRGLERYGSHENHAQVARRRKRGMDFGQSEIFLRWVEKAKIRCPVREEPENEQIGKSHLGNRVGNCRRTVEQGGPEKFESGSR